MHFHQALNVHFYLVKKIRYGVFLHKKFLVSNLKYENIGRCGMLKHTLLKLNYSNFPYKEGIVCILVNLVKTELDE